MVRILTISIIESFIGHHSSKALHLFEQTPNKILGVLRLSNYSVIIYHLPHWVVKSGPAKAYLTGWVFISKILDFPVKKIN